MPGAANAAQRFERYMQIGMVGVNAAIPVPMAFFSFGANLTMPTLG